MRFALIALALLAAASPAFAQKEEAGAVEDRVVSYETTHARMNAAIAEARALLPLFLEELRGATAPGAFTIKVALATSGGGSEHIWVGDLHYEGEQLVGNLINEPHDLPGMTLGSRVDIRLEDVSDWTISTPDGVYGGYTTRVMLDDMPAAEAARYREALRMTPHPTPPGWTQ